MTVTQVSAAEGKLRPRRRVALSGGRLHFAEAQDALKGNSSNEHDYADDDYGEEEAHGRISGQ